MTIKTRRQARESVLQAVYAFSMTQDSTEKIIKDFKRENSFEDHLEEFFVDLFQKTIENFEWSKKEITKWLRNWEYERLTLIDRAILQMMVTEMVFMIDIPPKVSITEGVEIAKEFGGEQNGAFVNGVLDAVFHHLEELKLAQKSRK